jgi:hypothetical protein
MRKLLPTLMVVLFVTSSATIAESAPQSPEMEVLNRWLGTWESHIAIEPSEWLPQGMQINQTANIEWVLGGQFQQAAIRGDEHEAQEIQRYDGLTRVYQRWSFDSNGITGNWMGIWNEESETMTWSFDIGVIKGTMVDRFLAAERYDTTVIIEDRQGKVLLNIHTEHTRLNK